jgi:hypothetical protein
LRNLCSNTTSSGGDRPPDVCNPYNWTPSTRGRDVTVDRFQLDDQRCGRRRRGDCRLPSRSGARPGACC